MLRYFILHWEEPGEKNTKPEENLKWPNNPKGLVVDKMQQ